MSSQCVIEMLEAPIPASFEDIENEPLDVLFALGIVNPLGPTLSFVAVVGTTSPGAVLPVVSVMLNPFSQTVDQVGRFTVGNRWTPTADFEPLIKLDFGSCPTLLLLNRSVPEDSRQTLAAQIFETFKDEIIDECRRVKSHFGDPFARIGFSMKGGAAGDADETLDPTSASTLLANLVLQPEHIWPELRAFLYAWRGSIEETRISAALRDAAFPVERFRDFLLQKVMPCCWVPNAPAEAAPSAAPPLAPFRPTSAEELRSMLRSENWKHMSSDELLSLASNGMVLYGAEVDKTDIPLLDQLYAFVVERTEPEHRALMAQQLARIVEKNNLSPAAFLPILVEDDAFDVVTTATIDFASWSSFNKAGEFYALVELDQLFHGRTLANPGAVFGALVSMGEKRFTPFLDRIRPLLKTDEIRVAARAQTQFLHHETVQYWLRWAEELVDRRSADSEQRFVDCQVALVLMHRYDRTGTVYECERDFPCGGKDKPIRYLRTWPLDEYAALIAPRLYELEARERPLKITSHTLRVWGFQPRAALAEQFIPPAGSPEDQVTRLRKLDAT